MKTTRRGFIAGLLAAPLIVKADMLMPVRAWTGFLHGDLVHGPFVGAQILDRIEGATAFLWDNSYSRDRLPYPVPVAKLSLFEGLPGNRVDNPSMRHRLIRKPGEIGLRYIGEYAT